jgi:hypothetical protein
MHLVLRNFDDLISNNDTRIVATLSAQFDTYQFATSIRADCQPDCERLMKCSQPKETVTL